MITTAELETQTKRDLAGTARDIGIVGWHSMKKEELIEAIRKAQEGARGKDSSASKPSSAAKASSVTKPANRGKKEVSASESVKRKRPVATKQPASKSSKSLQQVAEASVSPASSAAAGNAVDSVKKGRSSKAPKGASKAPDSASNSKALGSPKASKHASTNSPAASSPAASSAKKQPKDKPERSVTIGEPKLSEKSEASSGKVASSKAKRTSPPPRQPTSPEILKVLRKQQASAESRKDLSACVMVNSSASGDPNKAAPKERIVLIVRDSYWLQASWVITRGSVERARAAMGADWHTAEPVLRLLEVAHGASANTAEKTVRDIPIHGGVNNWYIDVENPPCRYRVVIGYRAANNRFFTLFRSNIVLTPEPGACDPIDGHWQDIAEDYERIYSLSDNDSGTGSNDLREMFEERLQRPMLDLKSDSQGLDPDLSFRRERDLPFEVDAELIVYGSTAPGASVTLSGSPVRLRPDGTFTVRMELPDRRQVIPVVACSRDGLRQRTTVVAVERNTKVMEPVMRHQMD